MKEAENIANTVFDCFAPPKQYEKPLFINGKMMLIKPLQPPYYKEKEKKQDIIHLAGMDFQILVSIR